MNTEQIGIWRYLRLDKPKAAGVAIIAIIDSLEKVQNDRGPMHDLKWIIKPSSRLGDERWIIGWKALFEAKETK